MLSELDTISHTCYIDGHAHEEEYITSVHIAIMIVSFCSLMMAWKQVYDISKEYMIYKRSIPRRRLDEAKSSEIDSKLKANVDWKKDWEELGFFDKLKFFDFWFIVIVTGNFFQLFGALVATFD